MARARRFDFAQGKLAAAVTLAAFACVLIAPAPALAQGCAMCKRALMSPEGQQMAAAFRSGIFVLLAAPFSLLGLISVLVVRLLKSRAAAAEPPSTADPA